MNIYKIITLLCFFIIPNIIYGQDQNLPLNVGQINMSQVLPQAKPSDDGLNITGPTQANVGEYVHLEVVGLPPIDSKQTLDEAMAWTKKIAMKVQQPPQSKNVDFDVTLGFKLFPVLSWKLTLDMKVDIGGDYAVAFAMPGINDSPVQLATHGIRFGDEGPGPTPIPDPSITITPEDAFSSQGKKGGPFDPSSKVYLITNVGKGKLNWSMNVDVPWLTLDPPNGTLEEGKSTNVNITINDKANTLATGTYGGAISFKNDTNGKGSSPRLVLLKVVGDNPPPPTPTSELWGFVLYESEDVDDYGPEVAKILASEKLRKLSDKFHFQPFDKDVVKKGGEIPSNIKPWLDIIKDKALPLPHIFFVNQDGKLVFNAPLPKDLDSTITLINKYLPK